MTVSEGETSSFAGAEQEVRANIILRKMSDFFIHFIKYSFHILMSVSAYPFISR